MGQSVENKVKSRIYGKGRGWCFTPKNFSDLGGVDAINTVLHRLEKNEFIRRLSHGLYDYPQTHEVMGLVWPDITSITKALAEKYSIKIQPSGAYAANLLGLSEQVPAKVVFLTDGESKSITIGKMEVYLKKTTPKNMKMAGKISGLVVQALRYIGKEHITEKMVLIIKRKLNDEDKKRLKLDADLAPAWISAIIKHELVGKDDG